MNYRKDQYVLCRYHGENGDIIAGCITSVRNSSTGLVLLENLLTGSRASKKAEVLARRNAVVPKKSAMKVADCFKEKGREEARKLAVLLVQELTEDEDEVKSVRVSVLTYKQKYCSDDCGFSTRGEHEGYCTLFNEGLDKDSRKKRHMLQRCDSCIKEEIEK